MAYSNPYEAFEAVLKSALPGVPVYQANMPFLKMDELARAAAKTATYLFFKDTERIRSNGASGVHNVIIEVNLFGPLDTLDEMASALTSLFLNTEPKKEPYLFSLVLQDKKDIWEPNIKAKRVWMQFKGLMIKESL